jgi:flagellar hook assembly protein FlgD
MIPEAFALLQNYPNPFNPTTTLRYGIPKDALVTLTVYNVLGQKVTTLKSEIQNVGFHNVQWNGRNDSGSPVSTGVYFYRLEAKPVDGSETFSSLKKMLLMK